MAVGIEMTTGTNVLVQGDNQMSVEARRGTLTGPVRYSESMSSVGGRWFWVLVDFGDGEPVQVPLEHVRHVRAAAV